MFVVPQSFSDVAKCCITNDPVLIDLRTEEEKRMIIGNWL